MLAVTGTDFRTIHARIAPAMTNGIQKKAAFWYQTSRSGLPGTFIAWEAPRNPIIEKPMSHDVVEGRVVVAAQRKYGVVIQHGTQRRSDPKLAGLHAAIQAGKFGRLKVSYGYCCKPRDTIGMKAPSASRATSATSTSQLSVTRSTGHSSINIATICLAEPSQNNCPSVFSCQAMP